MIYVIIEARDFGEELKDGDDNVLKFRTKIAARAYKDRLGLSNYIISWRAD